MNSTLESKRPKVLVACEFSGIVRDAFIEAGYDAVSCDLLPSERPGPHYKGDVRDLLLPVDKGHGFDLMIAFPPCTHLAVSGARWFGRKQSEQEDALRFFQWLLDGTHVDRVAIENPVGVANTRIRKPDQIIQPWQFGNEATKTTCLWLKALPTLKPTKVVGKGERHVTKSGKSLPKWYNLPPSEDRARIRSRTFPGIAKAMAEQWGPLL